MNHNRCNKNDPDELYQYGQMLYQGLKVRRNKIAAAQYFKAAADKGNLNAMIKYGRMLAKGDGISQNKEESIKYFKLAKEKRNQISLRYKPYKQKAENNKNHRNLSPSLPQISKEEGNKNSPDNIEPYGNDISNVNKVINLKNDQNSINTTNLNAYSAINSNLNAKKVVNQNNSQNSNQNSNINTNSNLTQNSNINTNSSLNTNSNANQNSNLNSVSRTNKVINKDSNINTNSNLDTNSNENKVLNTNLSTNSNQNSVSNLNKVVNNDSNTNTNSNLDANSNTNKVSHKNKSSRTKKVKKNDSNTNSNIDNNSNQKETSKENNESIQNKSQLPPIHPKVQPKQEEEEQTTQKPQPSKLPPIVKPQRLRTSEKIQRKLIQMNRLPQNYVPIHYDLYLRISEEKQLFEGSVTVTFQKINGFNSCYLNISENIEIKSIFQNEIPMKFIILYPILLIYQSNDDISTFPITINYTVKPNSTGDKGFFSFNDSYFTSFEPNLARNLLPCFDEPLVRSTFKVTLRIPLNLVGISNMPIQSITKYDDEKELTFQTTPPICTYLLCICIGNFSSIEDTMINDIPIKIYTTKDQENYDDFNDIIKFSNYAIDWIESSFKVKYELPHLQIIIHPAFKKEMGNYGLITFYDDFDINSSDCLLSIISGIIDQFFGGSVSIKWWDSIWLNEGFTSFLKYLIYQDFDDEIDIWNDFIEKKAIKSLEYFKTEMISPPENEIDFDNLFSPIIYEKGCFVVKMLYDIVGRDDFYHICSKWLNLYKNKTVEISDFVSLVNDVMKKDYTNFFNPWLTTVGFPILFVDEIIDENDSHHFIGINIKQMSINNFYYWLKVPVIYTINGELKKFDLLIDKEITTKFVEFDWIIVNDDIQSLCYVIYSHTLYKKVHKLSKKQLISKYNSYLLNESKKQDISDFVRNKE